MTTVLRTMRFCPLGLLLVLSLCVASLAEEVHDGNLFRNPHFTGAEDTLPPPGWEIYRELDANRRLSVIYPDDPSERALLIEDDAAVSGPNGEIGIMQTVPGGPGAYRAEVTFRGLEDAPKGTVYFQIRFLPSGERRQIDISPWLSDEFQTVAIEGTAPPGTTDVRVYLYTAQSHTVAIAVKSLKLFPAASGKPATLDTEREPGTFYVSPSGNDGNPGTLEAPWRSLEKASLEARPGDTIILLPGTYTGAIEPLRSGTKDAPITFRAAERLTAKLVGGPRNYVIRLDHVSHIHLEGLHVSPEAPRVWAIISNSAHVRLADSVFENSLSGNPFTITNSEQIHIVGNIFRHWHRDWKQIDQIPINTFRVFESRHLLFEGNAFGNAMHTNIQFRPEGRNEYVVMRGNVFHNAWGRTYEFFGTDYVLFEHNVVTNAFRGSRSADAQNKFSPEHGIYRFNRVFRNWGGPERFMSGYIGADQQKVHDVRVYHNVFDHNVAFGLSINVGDFPDIEGISVYKNNIITRNDFFGSHLQARFTTRSETMAMRGELPFLRNVLWADVPGAERLLRRQYLLLQDNNLFVDPLYADPERYHHVLAPGSPLIDAALPLTYAVDSGTGMVIRVEDAAYFYDGFGIEGELGDLIAVGRPDQTARVVKVDREENRLFLDREVVWNEGDPVGFPWSGNAPDIGVYEHGGEGRLAVFVEASAFELLPGENVVLHAWLLGGGTIEQVRWYLGDGTVVDGGPQLEHAYRDPGDYPVRVKVTETGGTAHWAATYLVVRDMSKGPGDPLLRFTFDADDTEWWKYWKAYRPEPTKWSRALERDGSGYLRIEAPDGNEPGIMLAWIYPAGWNLGSYIWWDVDQFPYVWMRYRVEPGTPVGIYLEAFDGASGRFAYLASTPAHQDGQVAKVGDALLLDDGAWHEITIDVRRIREAYPDVNVLQGIGLQTAANAPSKTGRYELDEVAILPASAQATGDISPVVTIVSPRKDETATHTLPVALAVIEAAGDPIARIVVEIDGRRLYEGSVPPSGLSLDVAQFDNGRYPLRVHAVSRAGRVGYAQAWVTVVNRWQMEDELLTPLEFFGQRLDRDLTSDTSAGWTYATSEPQRYFGDLHRRVWSGEAGEYLEWQVQGGLERIEVQLYTSLDAIDELIELSVSTDGASWRTVPYTVVETARAETGWRRLVLQGQVEGASEPARVRLSTLKAVQQASPTLQIGRVFLTGRIIPEE